MIEDKRDDSVIESGRRLDCFLVGEGCPSPVNLALPPPCRFALSASNLSSSILSRRSISFFCFLSHIFLATQPSPKPAKIPFPFPPELALGRRDGDITVESS